MNILFVIIPLFFIILFFSITNKEHYIDYRYPNRWINPYYYSDSLYMNNNNNIIDAIYNPFGYNYYGWGYPNPYYSTLYTRY